MSVLAGKTSLVTGASWGVAWPPVPLRDGRGRLGHGESAIKIERFGPTGDKQ
jgi:hypothetical protein